MQPKAADDLRRLVTDGLVERGLTYAHAAAFATPAPPDARRSRASPSARPRLREERKGPRADAPDAGASRASCAPPASPATQLEIRADKKGDVLVRRHRPPRPPRRRDRRRDRRGHRPRLPLAEVDALGRRHPALGPPAALDPLHPHPRDRRRGRAPRDRRHRRRRHHPRPPLPRPRRRSRVTSFEDYAAKLAARPRHPRPRRARRRGSPTTPPSSPSPPASSSSTTPASSPRTPASPNGR